jgi:hypothetical protein
MSLTAKNAQVYKGTAAITYGSGSGVSNRELQGTATITYGGAPTSNTALSLPGTSGNVMNLGPYFPSKADPSTSNIYVEAWIYLPTGATGMPFTVSDASSEDMGFLVNYSTSALQFRVWNTGGSGINSDGNGAALASATWYHIAGSFDRTNNRVYGFVNGVVGSTVGVFSGTARARSSSNMTIGAGNSGTFFPFNGYIRDFRMVKGGIVPTTSFTPAQAPFRLNTPSYVTGGSTVLSLYEQYFTPSLLSLPGITGSFMDFSTVPVARVNTSTTNMFIETWCYFNTLSGVEQYIAGTNTVSTQNNDDWGLRWDSGSNKIQAYHYNVSGSVGISFSLASPNASQWYHVAASFVIGTPGYIYLFVNGVLQNSGGTSMGGAPRYTAASTLWLGSPGNTGWGPSNVRIQDLRVVRGGTVPTATFTPAAAPFGLASPSYVSDGTTVLSLATQYYQTTTNGLLPQVFLGPTATYPTYTTTSAPVFNTSNVAFTGAGYSAGNFINFGQTTITMALGFSIILKFAWTGSYQSAYERIFDFGVAGGNSNAIIVCRNGTSSTLTFGNFVASSAQTITSTSTFPQNTDSGTVICVYDPASTGSLKMYVNGSLQATLAGITIIPNGSFPSSLIARTNATGLDPYSNVNIYSMKFYNRVLSAAEIARTASPIPYLQMTNRPILPAALVSPGNQVFAGVGGTFSISQTALQPLNGITWSAGPLGLISLVTSTDYLITFRVSSTPLFSSVFTVIATNKAGLSTVVQFNVSVTPIQPVLTNMALWIDPSTYPGTGTTITDSSGNGRTFTFAGTPLPTYVASPIKSIGFVRNSAFSTYNRLEINSIFLGDDMTIQAWISTSNVGQDTWHYLLMTIMATEVGGPGNDWGFGVNNSGKLSFGAGTSDTTIASTSSVNTGTWINVAATRVKSSGLITLYLNGASNGSGTGNAGNSLTSATKVWIGSGQDGGYSFGGLIGQVLAYTSALSAADIAYNFSISRSTYGI